QCDYLLIHAGDDQQLPPTLTERLCKRFRDHHKSNYRLLVYPGAGHLLEPPYSPHFYATYQALFSHMTVWGGTAKAHNTAQKDAWREILHFFRSKLEGSVQHFQNKL
ncbi:hypothetical protein LSH36_37g11003, partial [Paralvinella palmiformis]